MVRPDGSVVVGFTEAEACFDCGAALLSLGRAEIQPPALELCVLMHSGPVFVERSVAQTVQYYGDYISAAEGAVKFLFHFLL